MIDEYHLTSKGTVSEHPMLCQTEREKRRRKPNNNLTQSFFRSFDDRASLTNPDLIYLTSIGKWTKYLKIKGKKKKKKEKKGKKEKKKRKKKEKEKGKKNRKKKKKGEKRVKKRKRKKEKGNKRKKEKKEKKRKNERKKKKTFVFPIGNFIVFVNTGYDGI